MLCGGLTGVVSGLLPPLGVELLLLVPLSELLLPLLEPLGLVLLPLLLGVVLLLVLFGAVL